MTDGITTTFMIIGLFFMMLGSIGILRLPDVYCRMHAATKTTTLGMSFILLSSITHMGYEAIGPKAILVILFLFLTNPVSAHMIARAGYRTQVSFWEKTHRDELKGELTHVDLVEERGEVSRHAEK